MGLFRGKFRIDTARLKGWDYSMPGAYFITICTQDRAHHFGKIIAGEMHLSPIGEIVAEEWQKTPAIRTYVELGAWILMPNHFHAVIGLTQAPLPEGPAGNQTSPQNWKPGSLGALLNQFKSICTKRIWSAGYRDFAWQPRYYDHIIRDEKDMQYCQEYILANPGNWEKDDFR